VDAVQDFDVATDRANCVIALLSTQLADARAQPVPGTDHIQALTQRRDHFIAARGALVVDDPDAVAALYQECMQVLRAAQGRD